MFNNHDPNVQGTMYGQDCLHPMLVGSTPSAFLLGVCCLLVLDMLVTCLVLS